MGPLVRDYERRVDLSQAMIFVAMGGNLMCKKSTLNFPNRLRKQKKLLL